MRLAIGWLEDRFLSAHGDSEDAYDFLEGKDQAIVQRAQQARRATVARAGGEIG